MIRECVGCNLSKRGSAPLYPRYFSSAPERTLALYDATLRAVVDEHGNVFHIGDNLSTFKDLLFSRNLLTFTDSIVKFPFLDEMIRDYPHCEVRCTSKGVVTGVRIHGPSNSTRWLANSHSWTDNTDGLLATLRAVFDHCKVGTCPTPGALGQTIMRTTFKEHGLQRHTRPHSSCINDLHKHSFGGRVDTPGLGETYEKLIELDRKNAYVSEYGRHPTGTAVSIAPNYNRGNARFYYLDPTFVTWFGECEVTLPHRLRYGPFPTRQADFTIEYPTAPGQYHTWLWKEQAEDICVVGGNVKLIHGWGWQQWTEDNQHWCAIMEMLRRTAPTTQVEAMIKKAAVAGIGRHAMSNISYLLVPEEHAGPDDECIAEEGRFYNFYVHPFSDPFHSNMVHWNAYTVMQCSRALYQKALPYANLGWLVSTNYDAIYLKLWGYEEIALPEKGSAEDRDARSGTWRHRIIYRNDDSEEPTIPAPRALNAKYQDGSLYVRRPGVKQ